MLIQSASELLAEAEKLAAEAEGGDGKDAEGKEGDKEEGTAAGSSAAGETNGAAEPPSGFEHAEGEAAAAKEEDEEESMTPAQTAQHFAMRNLMNAGGTPGPGPTRSRHAHVPCRQHGATAWRLFAGGA